MTIKLQAREIAPDEKGYNVWRNVTSNPIFNQLPFAVEGNEKRPNFRTKAAAWAFAIVDSVKCYRPASAIWAEIDEKGIVIANENEFNEFLEGVAIGDIDLRESPIDTMILLELITGHEWSYKRISGDLQSDSAIAYIDTQEIDTNFFEIIESAYFNTGREFAIFEDGENIYNHYVYAPYASDNECINHILESYYGKYSDDDMFCKKNFKIEFFDYYVKKAVYRSYDF